MCYLAELRQRDRLIDSQVYLKVLNWREVHVVAQNDGDFACPSATLLLASILRVSIIPNPSHTYIPNLPSHMPTASPFISTSTLSTTSGKVTLGDKRLRARVVAASAAGSCGRRQSRASPTLNLTSHIRRGREPTLARRTGETSYKMRSVPCIRPQDQGVTL